MSEEQPSRGVGVPDPSEIYKRTEEEGRRRLSRPPLELAATAFVAGLDVVFGIVALGTAHHYASARWGDEVGTLVGALAFGIAFVFIIVGRSELFTENFLVPLAAVSREDRRSWLKLGELWLVSPILNVIGGVVLILIVTTNGVLPDGTGDALVVTADKLDENDILAALMSAIAAGGLITLMTWLVEGQESVGVRAAAAYLGGVLLALGAFNHVIVVTLELIVGMRYGADIGWGDLASNFGIAAVGNLVGGLLLVTLTRFSQAHGALRGGA
jgi:formate/nitrite transporter FocA (FNT family)